MMRALIALVLLIPTLAMAEGARVELACEPITSCDDSGACVAGVVGFDVVIAPVDTDADGVGTYDVSTPGDPAIRGYGASRLGPFIWEPAAGTRHSLTIVNKESAVLVRHTIDGSSAHARIDMLQCEVTL